MSSTPSDKETAQTDRDAGSPSVLKVAFTGDTVFFPEYCGSRTSCDSLFDADIIEALRRQDYAVFNIEGPITSAPPARTYRNCLRSVPESVDILRSLNCNVLDLANNHICDHGLAGLRDTIAVARANGWAVVGAGEDIAQASAPVILSGGGVTVGLVAVCCAAFDVDFAGAATAGIFSDASEDRIRAAIEETRSQSDWVVVVYHGGEEFTHVPMPSRRRRLLRYLRYGADVVVAHHAHCVQRYEVVGEKYVFYGLGNLLLDDAYMRANAGTQESVVLSLRFGKRSVSFEPLFTFWDRQRQRATQVDSNQEFRPVTSQSYAAQWGPEAYRRLRLAWDEKAPVGPGLVPRTVAFVRKVRRIVMCVRVLRRVHERPFLLGGIGHVVRKALRFGR
jgi:hypothetical protein